MAKKKENKDLKKSVSREAQELLEAAYQAYAASLDKPVEELSDEDRSEALAAAGLVELSGSPEDIEELRAYLDGLEGTGDSTPDAHAPGQQLPPGSNAAEFFAVGKWKGNTQHRCKLCPWDTLNGEVAMLEHIARTHIAVPMAPPHIPVANAAGKQVN